MAWLFNDLYLFIGKGSIKYFQQSVQQKLNTQYIINKYVWNLIK